MLLLNTGEITKQRVLYGGNSVVKRNVIDERRWPYLLSWNGFNLD